MNEAYRIAAWLRANAKHMGAPWEIEQMMRAAVVMNLLANEVIRLNELQKQEAPGDCPGKPLPALRS
jgi:hypothetical protein